VVATVPSRSLNMVRFARLTLAQTDVDA